MNVPGHAQRPYRGQRHDYSWRAVCSCHWVGPERFYQRDALKDYRAHREEARKGAA